MRDLSFLQFLQPVFLATLFCGSSGFALADSPQIGGVIDGFISDGSGIRPLIGVPGSAYLGAPIIITSLDYASIAPNGVSALVIQNSSVQFVADLRVSVPLPLNVSVLPDSIFWSNDASAAALFSSKGRSLQFVRDIAQSRSIGPLVDLSYLSGSLRVLTADPLAGIAVISTAAARDHEIYVVGESQHTRISLRAAPPSAAALGKDGTVYVAAGSELWKIPPPYRAADAQMLLGGIGTESKNSVADLLLAPTPNVIFVLDRSDNHVRSFNLNTLEPADDLDAGYAVTAFQAFNSTTYILNAGRKPQEAVVILQTLPKPMLLFVPAGQ